MPTIVVTPKATDANAYITRAGASSYLADERLYTSEWTDATDDDKDRAIIYGAFLLDVCFDLPGYAMTQEQAMRWPRSGIEDRDGRFVDYDTIPRLIEKANAVMAHELIKTNSLERPELLGLGILELKAGPVELKMDKSILQPFIPASVTMIMGQLGAELLASAQQGTKVIRLIRS